MNKTLVFALMLFSLHASAADGADYKPDISRFVTFSCSSADHGFQMTGSFVRADEDAPGKDMYSVDQINKKGMTALAHVGDQNEFTSSPSDKLSFEAFAYNSKSTAGLFIEVPRINASEMYSTNSFPASLILTTSRDDQSVQKRAELACQVERRDPKLVAQAFDAIETIDTGDRDVYSPDNGLEDYDSKLLKGTAKKSYADYKRDYGSDFGDPLVQKAVSAKTGNTYILISISTDGGGYADVYNTDGTFVTGRADSESENGSWSVHE